MKVQIQKWGNSLGLRIPKPFAEEAHLKQNTNAQLSIKDGKLILSPILKKSHTLNEMLKNITSQNVHLELQTGLPVGREVW